MLLFLTEESGHQVHHRLQIVGRGHFVLFHVLGYALEIVRVKSVDIAFLDGGGDLEAESIAAFNDHLHIVNNDFYTVLHS